MRVSAGTRDAGSNLPHPGTAINFPTPGNPDRLAPGVVIQNNIIAYGTQGAISYSGDAGTNPNAAVPFGRIVNNTLVGYRDSDSNPNTPMVRSGIGVNVGGGASPTLLNNIVAGFTTGIQDGGVGTVVGSTYFQDNGATGPRVAM